MQQSCKGDLYAENNVRKYIHSSLEEFKDAENYLSKFHQKNGQHYVKFYFPDNIKPPGELMDFLKTMDFEIGYMELYAIEPNQFPLVNNNPNIEIRIVTTETFESYLQLQYEEALTFGEKFATQQMALHKRNFEDEQIQQVIAFYKGIPAGSVDVIVTNETVEIDGLAVDKSHRKKGIGSRLQKFVMDQFSDKLVILVADGEDTPREMYIKQNYKYLGFKYEVQKVFEK